MKDLIERLEKAEGPSRELDCYIHADVVRRSPLARIRVVGRPTYDHTRYFFHPDNGEDWIGYDLLTISPHYTRSLDAAVSLVPEGMAWTLGQNVHHRYWQACVNTLDADGAPKAIGFSGHHGMKSPAIALTIAALRARSALSPVSKGEA